MPKHRPRSSRSVTGCLTCRRRKVKCTSQVTPCDPCRRLKLSCNSSFDQNFKTWESTDLRNDGQFTQEDARRSNAVEEPIAGPSRRTSRTTTATVLGHELGAGAGEPGEGAAQSIMAARDTNKESTLDNDPFGLLGFIFSDLTDEMIQVDFSAPGNIDTFDDADWAVQRPCIPGPYDAGRVISCGETFLEDATGNVSAAPSRDSAGQATSGTITGPPLDPTTSQALSRVPELMSTKRSIYTCFHYLMRSAQAVPDSPLCHAIIGWVYAYLGRFAVDRLTSSREEYYKAASSAIAVLVTDLMAQPTPELRRRINTSEQLSSYLSATFFLCQHDLAMGSYTSFINRIAEAKSVFQHHWADRTLPGPVESRIVIWLGFLELRFFYLGGERYACTDGQQDFMTLLEETKALSALRRARTQKSVLSEMFPDNLPKEEDEEDLRKDRCRVQFDDLMCHLARMRRFALWDRGQAGRQDGDPALLKELRDAKVEALYAHLRRLQAECELAMPSSKTLPSSDDSIDSITFHTLSVRALRASTIIMFKRVTETASRTDSECHAAVADILRIARLLRQADYLCSPRSTIWPLPLYIAGIETTDSIYQDWILDYFKDFTSWGEHMKLAADELRCVMSLQEKTSIRAPLAR
ncbi:Fungal transcriptional regulatory protein [Cordyceps javanica]|uniref:Fungal transcriptional regulatory protein n=1 Tax=Cordyceps javanica TaxID=43265 RepID=A0A545V4V9_9HYPO|nr:Fungal transcriptional regulatory protein [Cordyceps javanica]TQW07993.1 Fungal transcriptional regulatory protein [Cordyceps javanica]